MARNRRSRADLERLIVVTRAQTLLLANVLERADQAIEAGKPDKARALIAQELRDHRRRVYETPRMVPCQ